MLDSTNRWLLEEARSGRAAAGWVAVADHQTAGRGRLGRTWEAPSGSPGANLLASLLLRPELPPERLHLVTAAVAVAASAVTGAGIKWPNDLVVGPDSAKLAGVLAEADLPWVVVGIGLNIGWAPEGAARLCDLGDGRSRDEVLAALLDELAPLVSGDGGWSTVPALYRARCVTLGRTVRVELPDPADTFTGTAADITDEGHLLVETDVCVKTVAAADIVHLR